MNGTTRKAFWGSFCDKYSVAKGSVSLFDTAGLDVQTTPHGKDRRPVLKRSSQMEELVVSEVRKVVADYESGGEEYDGIIYMMLRMNGEEVVPLYVGKSEKYGKNDGNLSENIKGIEKRNAKFCRWGYGYEYHLGDLSAIVLPGHSPEKRPYKYIRWADSLFVGYPTLHPRLRQATYFWCKAWNGGDVGPWQEFGATSLTYLEYLLIGLASSVFPDDVLNDEGVNR